MTAETTSGPSAPDWDATSPGEAQAREEQPLITVGLPTYQRAHSLPRAIDSVLVQTYENLASLGRHERRFSWAAPPIVSSPEFKCRSIPPMNGPSEPGERDASPAGETQASIQEPLITVGIPTFQRAHTLRRAIDSVLAQTYVNLELVLADNASQDGTEAICEEYLQLDRRVRYFRQATNVGPTENFNSILGRARGEYIIFLGDDDWIEATCLGHCFEALKDHPDRVLAHGRVRYFDGDELVRAPEPLDLIESSPSQRVKAYYDNVGWNEEIYGLIRRDVWVRVAPLPKGIGSDYGFVARIVFLGKAVTLDTIEVNRSLGGIGGHAADWARADGLSLRQAHSPTLSAAWLAALDLAWRSPVYRTLSSRRRVALALSCIPLWTLRRYRIEVHRQRNNAMYKVRKRSRRWSRRFDRSWHRSLKRISKRVRVLRRRSVRLVRQRLGALVLRR